MIFSEKKDTLRWLIIIVSMVVLGLFIWVSILFFEQLKKEERKKMEIWVDAQTQLIENDDPEKSINPVLLSVIEQNTSTPMILYSEKDDVYEGKNISEEDTISQEELKVLAKTYRQQYKPIAIYDQDKLYGTVYYGNSRMVTQIKYFPAVLVTVVFLFLIALYYFYTISKSNEQNKLWAGMARETAHQIGTPLSSLVGWTELLKAEHVNPDYVSEMERDVDRLKIITERFSKIGSVPTVSKTDLVKASTDAFEYLTKRSSRMISFSIEAPDHPIYVHLNEQLLGWTIENLIKNAADAVRGEGKIGLYISEDSKWAYMHLSDTGKGISKRNLTKIFKPGVTSKKRGWGLGLSLARRIIQEYHQGKIRVLKSEVGKGTTFEIRLRKV